MKKTYIEKLERATQQHEAIERSKGQPGPKFNQYLKTRKSQHAEVKHAGK